MGNATKLSSSVSVAKYKELEAADDRAALGSFVIERFDERYFKPVDDSPSKHGFASLAVSCLVIEALESFYQGLGSTKDQSTQMFTDFLARKTPLKVLGGNDPDAARGTKNWFYKDIRCGILHQAEARGGWLVMRKGPLLDPQKRVINATAVLRALRQEVKQYAKSIETDDDLWKKFKVKMSAVLANCN